MSLFYFCISLAIVSLGQPARFGFLSCLAAICGFTLFFLTLKKNRFFWAVIWFTAVQCIQLSWMTSIEFQGYYILVLYLVLALLMGCQFGLLTLLVPKEGKLSSVQLLSCAGFWTCMEWVRLLPTCGFSWNPIGLALTGSEISLQFASIAGVFGLSFWVMLTNLSLLNWIRGGSKVSACVLPLIPYLFGACHFAYHLTQAHEKTLQVALVQTDLLPSEKALHFGREKEFIPRDLQWERIIAGFKASAIKNCDLIILPEAFIPGGASNLFLCQVLANRFGAEVVAGLDYTDKVSKKNFNSAFYIQPHHSQVQRYDKQILLPLAEYLPFDSLRVLTRNYGIFDFFSKGTEAKIMGEKMRFSPSICYEETFPELMRKAKNQGAELFVNLTNDNYYPASSLHRQHLFHARLRAIENGIPLIRSCNAGVSAVVDSFGRIVAQLEESKAGILVSQLNTYTFPTLYSYLGDRWLIIFSALIVLYQLFLRFRSCLK